MTSKHIDLILNQDINHLGNKGDIVKVSKGYARNYLLPSRSAELLTIQRLKYTKFIKERKNAINSEMRIKNKQLKEQLEAIRKFSIKKKVSETDNIFGSVTEKDIIQVIQDSTGTIIERNQVQLTDIKSIGIYPVQIHLMSSIIAEIQLQILPETL
uniref:50S ribosomal protein L9, chloroplastic n=1 Tax=Balbiania investiens TaxID=111861 RepID=A0A4D6BNM4_9FLOR|nr:ribosomal protein L9 [Balbiania investiens]QBX88579.1 ribosomal protein L9 [Balbiania investiens]